MKLRLFLRKSIADANGILAEKQYKSVIVEIPDELKDYDQIEGGEWLE